jgi:hypothetical protein
MKQESSLSHIITKVGMSVDSSKIQDTLSCNALTSVVDVCSPLGLVGYYRRFIKGFLKTTKPMTELLEKDKKLKKMLVVKLDFRSRRKN